MDFIFIYIFGSILMAEVNSNNDFLHFVYSMEFIQRTRNNVNRLMSSSQHCGQSVHFSRKLKVKRKKQTFTVKHQNSLAKIDEFPHGTWSMFHFSYQWSGSKIYSKVKSKQQFTVVQSTHRHQNFSLFHFFLEYFPFCSLSLSFIELFESFHYPNSKRCFVYMRCVYKNENIKFMFFSLCSSLPILTCVVGKESRLFRSQIGCNGWC